MRLKNVLIENFRGIRRLDLDFDDITVVIAENNHGKTSVFDVLGLCLGARGSSPDARFRESDFYLTADGSPQPIRIRLTFDGDEAEDGDDAEGGAARGDAAAAEPVRLQFSSAGPGSPIHRTFVDARGDPVDPQLSPGLLEHLQRTHPVLLLRFAQPRRDSPGGADAGGEVGGPDRRGPRGLAATVARVYHDLAHTRGSVPAEQITQGLEAARRLLTERDAAGPGDASVHRMLDELRAEVRRWGRPKSADAGLTMSGSGSHNLALLLVLGSILDVGSEEAFPSESRPIIAIEEPEAHLHPILLASTWDVIQALRAQTVVTTNSGELLSFVPMTYLRRLVRDERGIEVYRLGERSLSKSDMRRVAYHIRAKRGGVLFARCWLLVEGESEFWLLTQLAHVLGYDLEAEGVRLIEFAQCGVAPLAKLANDMGIRWHLLADGDESGSIYARDAEAFFQGDSSGRQVSKLGHRDVELCLWHHGFEDVYRQAARIVERPDGRGPPPRVIISKAVRRRSKPFLALAVAEACAERGRRSIPPVLRSVIESAVSMARDAVEPVGPPPA